MARLTFPSDRLVYTASAYAGSAFTSAANAVATVYSDSAGTTLADVQNFDGSPNAAATFTVDTTSRLPQFLGPAAGTDTLYAKVGAGPVTAIYAVTAGDISAAVGIEVTNRTAADAAHVAASNPHSVTPQMIGAPTVVVHGATAGTTRPAGATFVHWIGSVAPTNVTGNDEWTDTANKILKRWNGSSFDSLGNAASSAAGSDWKNFVTHYAADPTGVAGGHAAKLNQWFADTPNGGTLYVPDGVYLCDDAQTSGTAFSYSYSGQVLIPARSQAQQRPTWRIVGPRQQILSHWGSVLGENEPLAQGAVFKSTATTGAFLDVIPGLSYLATTPLTNAIVELEDISVRLPNNANAAGLKLVACGGVKTNGVSVEVSVTDTNVTRNTNANSVGIYAPGLNNQTLVSIKNTGVVGYNVGLRISEHAVLDGFNAEMCNVGLQIDPAGHPIFLTKVMLQWNTTHIKITQGPTGSAIVGHVGFESKTSGWWTTTYDIDDAGGYAKGLIYWSRNGLSTEALALNGAAQMQLKNIWTLGTGAASTGLVARASFGNAGSGTVAGLGTDDLTGISWGVTNGTAQRINGKAQLISGSTEVHAILAAGSVNREVEALITTSPTALSTTAGLLVLQAAIGDFLTVQIQITSGVNNLTLQKCAGGSYTTLATDTSITYTSGTEYLVRARYVDGRVLVWVNDVLKISLNMTSGDAASFNNPGYANAGFRSYRAAGNDDGGTLWDNLTIRAA